MQSENVHGMPACSIELVTPVLQWKGGQGSPHMRASIFLLAGLNSEHVPRDDHLPHGEDQ